MNPFLFADSKPLDDALIATNIFLFEVGQQTAPLADHLEEAATGMMVLAMRLEVLGKVGNALAQNRNLYLWRARVRTVELIVSDQVSLSILGERQIGSSVILLIFPFFSSRGILTQGPRAVKDTGSWGFRRAGPDEHGPQQLALGV